MVAARLTNQEMIPQSFQDTQQTKSFGPNLAQVACDICPVGQLCLGKMPDMGGRKGWKSARQMQHAPLPSPCEQRNMGHE